MIRRTAGIQAVKEVIHAAIPSCWCLALNSPASAEEFVLRTWWALSCLLRLFRVCDCSPMSHVSAFPLCAWLAEILMNNRLQTANNEK